MQKSSQDKDFYCLYTTIFTIIRVYNKRLRNTKGQLRKSNPKTPATLDTGWKLKRSARFWYLILEVFRQCGIFCFSFYLHIFKGHCTITVEVFILTRFLHLWIFMLAEQTFRRSIYEVVTYVCLTFIPNTLSYMLYYMITYR
jgi:hypothetical protein